ncbi:Fe(3+)-hydroxamate ABC transporter permease FhuB [Muricoccus aerilatus]|uniref:Fe(3+)-hydroxamate ABC transporter permease FhuB n=1 Tax=Muricoccus aerilatus TaxID=452982 RepID=UPI0005C23334|nr:Fe(3+)-hydroxamate ABC transporter permease FhuB [Roseomonas aerilata]
MSVVLPSGGGQGARLCLILGLLVALAASVTLHAAGGVAHGLRALWAPAAEDVPALFLHYAWWPRLAVSLLAGAGLALAGTLMQQLLRNPLASPMTLGVAPGANVALMAATLYAPAALEAGREWIAFAGGGLAMLLVFAIAWRRQLSPVVTVLAGLVVNLQLGAVAVILLLSNYEALSGQLIWGAGSLAQNGWGGALYLLPRLAIGAILMAMLLRPLAILEIGDAGARSLGIPLGPLRFAGLGLAVLLTGSIVSSVGVIGFIGLVAPNIVRMAGVRALPARAFWAALLGALLLALTDLGVQYATGCFGIFLTTGAMTSLLGAPILLWLLAGLRPRPGLPRAADAAIAHRHGATRALLGGLGAALLAMMAIGLALGQSGEGWAWLTPGSAGLLEWRLPRVLAAAGGGTMLALAGVLIQRLTGNPMASPEVLGISGGCGMALLLAVFLLPAASGGMLVGIGIAGAAATLAALLLLNRRTGFAPERVLLTGVAVNALFGAVQATLLARGDPRGQEALAWLAGSTYYLDAASGVTALGLAIALTIAAGLFVRWLEVLPLGATVARGIGIPVLAARLALLLLVSLLTACATLVVGPLSFVGLLGPHLARLLGLHRAGQQLAGAALAGALLMVTSDWIGRQILFPWEIPAGIVASLLGGAYFIWGLRRL